jgi:hypothetical protein
VDLEAPGLWFLGEVMADGHLQPGRSAFLRYVDVFDILLLEAITNYGVSSSKRGTASSCTKLCSPATRTTGCSCKGRVVIFLFPKGVFVRM